MVAFFPGDRTCSYLLYNEYRNWVFWEEDNQGGRLKVCDRSSLWRCISHKSCVYRQSKGTGTDHGRIPLPAVLENRGEHLRHPWLNQAEWSFSGLNLQSHTLIQTFIIGGPPGGKIPGKHACFVKDR
jgi:hypothetical protein